MEFFTPIQRMSTIDELKQMQGQGQVSKTSNSNVFESIFSSAIENVKTTQSDLEEKQYLLATGQIDDTHTVSIAAAEAQLSVDLLVELRNKAVESYNELMRINL